LKESQQITSLEICVSGLKLVIGNQSDFLKFSLPQSHQKFSAGGQGQNWLDNGLRGVLELNLVDDICPSGFSLMDSICRTEIFEVIEDLSGLLTFLAPRHKPPRVIEIDPQFNKGKIIGNFSQLDGNPFYPLQYIDIVIFSNWLALFGDVIMHSAGVAYDGRGYCFMGKSGAGKSTLAGLLSKQEGVTVLGEDQVILRYIDNRFWIFGTPWHVHPDLCSPLGVPLEKVFFLKREDEEMVMPVFPAEGYRRIIQNSFIPFYRKQLVSGIIQKLSLLSENTPFNEMSFRLESDILSFIFNKN